MTASQPKNLCRRVFKGNSASAGIAIGPAWRLCDQAKDTPVQIEASHTTLAALDDAIEKAKRELEQLSSSSESLGAEILAFQIELLDDEDIESAVRQAALSGSSPLEAWRAELESTASVLELSGDDYMAARSADVRDVAARVAAHLFGRSADTPIPEHAIVIADDIPPSRFLEMDWARLGGAVLTQGTKTGHVAILARTRGIPLITSTNQPLDVCTGDTILLDATFGTLIVHPNAKDLQKAEIQRKTSRESARAAAEFAGKPAVTADGKRIEILINVNTPADLDDFDITNCDGIGLVRTEFLFDHGLPDEMQQTEIYSDFVRRADGRPVTIRTLDAGGDKPISGLTIEGESNPFLGTRGIRLSLHSPDTFQTQLRALLRASVFGPLKIMLPMVTIPSEVVSARHHLEIASRQVEASGFECGRPELGMMLEVPAAAITAGSFDVEFYSIGSNDLIQYATAAARDGSQNAALLDPLNPAILELIRLSVIAANRRNVSISVCGDMAATPECIPALLSLGLTSLSVPPPLIGFTKLAVTDFKENGLP